MEITSFAFIGFFAALLVLYYIVPKRVQWVLLLAGSLFYYWLAGSRLLILYPAAAVTVTYVTTWLMDLADGKDGGGGTGDGSVSHRSSVGHRTVPCPTKKAALIAEIVILIGILALLKYMKFGQASGAAGSLLQGLAVPLGLSFYTFTLVGYAIDVANGLAERQRNFFKLLLFGMFFPTMVSGPIAVYSESGVQLYEPHRFSYEHVTKGVQRMVWGFMKKLVIAERAATLSNTIFDNYSQYPGAYIWFGALMFTIQLYTDFSGCMDIVIGAAECFGVTLPENFTQPFFSKSISEYWRRWHITLGVWMRNYVFYPLLRTQVFTKLGKTLRRRFGKKQGKNLTTYMAMFILWLSVGLWHGGDVKYVIGSGLLHWFYIVFGMATLPFFTLVCGKLHIKMEGRGADLFRIIRTFILVNIGNVFFNAASAGDAAAMLRLGVSVFNPQVLVNGSLLGLGLDIYECLILAFSVALLWIVSILEVRPDKDGNVMSVRDRAARLPLPARWILYLALVMFVVIFGNYGPGYSSGAFIYQGF